MSPNESKFLINLMGEKISKKDTAFKKVISVQELGNVKQKCISFRHASAFILRNVF